MHQEEHHQRQALVEGFIDMSNMGALREDQADRIFDRAGAGDGDGKGHDYVELEDEYLVSHDGEGGGRIDKAELKENTNVFKSAFHVFKANVGTGVFMLPTFYKGGGYVISVILAIMIGSIVVDCTNLLLRTKLRINRRDVTTYSQLCKFVLGTGFGWFLFVALCLTQFGFCLMFSQLFALTFDQLVSFKGSQYLWVSLVFIVGFPMTCFSDNLSLLSISSIVATVCVFYSLICCLVESCKEIASRGGKPHPTCTYVGEDIPIGWFNNLANNMMVLEGIAIVLPVHAACTQKRLVPRMITIVLSCVICWYLLFGLTGYIAFGTSIEGSLVNRVEQSPWGTSIRVLFMINVVLSYPLQFMSAMQLIDQTARCKPRSWLGLLLRCIINLVIWALAMGIPPSAVDIVVAFIGALPSTWMVLILPCTMAIQVNYAVAHPDEPRGSKHYWKIFFAGEPGKRCTWLRVRCFIYCILAFLIMIIGTYSIVVNQIMQPSGGNDSNGDAAGGSSNISSTASSSLSSNSNSMGI